MTARLFQSLLIGGLLFAGARALADDSAPASARPAVAQAADAAVPVTTLSGDQLLSALTRDLADHFRLEGDFHLEFMRPWTPLDRTAAAWDVVVMEYPVLPSANLIVRCQLMADGATAADLTLSLRASLWRDAWFAREPITSGSTFDSTMLDARRIDWLRERNALPASVGDDSFIFARQVPADRMLTWQDIARRPLVRKGDVVDVIASEGGLLVTMKAQAIESGVRGDTVTVRNIETLKNISGQVVSEDRVEVRF
jgi:flagellar basal body P-ring formation protein FlgA